MSLQLRCVELRNVAADFADQLADLADEFAALLDRSAVSGGLARRKAIAAVERERAVIARRNAARFRDQNGGPLRLEHLPQLPVTVQIPTLDV